MTIDAISDLTTGGVVGSSAKGAASNVVKNVAGSEGNKLARGVKTVLKESGVDITRNINNTVKETSKNLVKQLPEKIGATAENVTKVVTSPTKDEIKKRTNH